MISTLDIAKFAGLVEGEGCIIIDKRWQSPILRIVMTDLDVMEWIGRLVGRKVFKCSITNGHKIHLRDFFRR